MYSNTDCVNTLESVHPCIIPVLAQNSLAYARAADLLLIVKGWGRAALGTPAPRLCMCSCKENCCGTGQKRQAWKSRTARAKALGMSSPSLAAGQCWSLICTSQQNTHIYQIQIVLHFEGLNEGVIQISKQNCL